MRHFKLSFLPGVLALVTLLIGMQPVVPVAASSLRNATTSSCDRWHLVSIPTREQMTSDLYSLAAISSNDIWIVGLSYPNKVLAPSSTLTEHWNGSSWSIIPSANYGSNSNHLHGVAALSSNDVWAVGDYYIDRRGSGGKTLIERWNGTQWNVVPSPNGGNAFSELSAVATVSSNDVWAVGNFINLSSFQNQTLIEHWDGTRWSVIPSANPGASNNALNALTVVSANNIWAVGSYAQTNGHDLTLIEHWNGTTWSVVPSPNVGGFGNFLTGVSAISSQNVWAVGNYNASSGGVDTLVEHWDGNAWSIVPSPNPESALNAFEAVSAASANDIWAVGYGYDNNTSATTLIEHWNGTRWSVVPSPNRRKLDDSLIAVTALSAHDIWSVGNYLPSDLMFETFSEHYC